MKKSKPVAGNGHGNKPVGGNGHGNKHAGGNGNGNKPVHNQQKQQKVEEKQRIPQ